MREASIPWSPIQAISSAMADGESWFMAWGDMSRSSYRHLSRDTGIAATRIKEIAAGSTVTRDELARLAKAWDATVNDLTVTLPPGSLAE